ncbi:uncharacterized protein PV09_01131 [Verruconis gallopava]|uniref:Ribonuclease H2 subunit B n=1 Tax=Verruconis gallopava TaxID=253628 RepID=A0A0D1XZF7_9PEZI|nr:uncharacterized protein PV09_01131 [Verruconis gallopava]KIW08201.1 hypothetical protein PV09_01131 [Verruconis gallopava]
MVTTRSSPKKRKQPQGTQPNLDQDLEEGEDVAPEDVKVDIADADGAGKKLQPKDSNPPRLFIIPKGVTKEARIVTLPEPSEGAASRYLVCPEKGVYEFTKVSAPKSHARCVLLAPDDEAAEHIKSVDEVRKSSISQGYIAESADIFVATPIDPAFLLLPILAPASTQNQKRLFVAFDDYVDSTAGTLRQLLRQGHIRKHFESRLDVLCDKVEAGDESLYRLSTDKLASLLVSKAQRMVRNGLPASMEEKFIRQALQAPILSIKREGPFSTASTTEEAAAGESQTSSEISSQKDSTFSQASVATSVTAVSISDETTTSDVPQEIKSNEASPEIKHLLRLRTALQYMSTSYIPSHMRSSLHSSFDTLIDYSALDAYLKQLEALREEARALRSLSDNMTRKRGLDGGDEVAEERAEKKRKKEEEEKKRKQESHALKQLKKADISGMKKLSSFFTKVPKKT